MRILKEPSILRCEVVVIVCDGIERSSNGENTDDPPFARVVRKWKGPDPNEWPITIGDRRHTQENFDLLLMRETGGCDC